MNAIYSQNFIDFIQRVVYKMVEELREQESYYYSWNIKIIKFGIKCKSISKNKKVTEVWN